MLRVRVGFIIADAPQRVPTIEFFTASGELSFVPVDRTGLGGSWGRSADAVEHFCRSALHHPQIGCRLKKEKSLGNEFLDLCRIPARIAHGYTVFLSCSQHLRERLLHERMLALPANAKRVGQIARADKQNIDTRN